MRLVLSPPPFDRGDSLAGWLPVLKRYPHFDKYLPEDEIIRLVSDPERVAKNAFFPFILYIKVTDRFPGKVKISSVSDT